MKKIIALISCVIAVNFLLSGCSSKDESNHSSEKNIQTEVTKPSDQIAGKYVVVSGYRNGKSYTAEEILEELNDHSETQIKELYIDLKASGVVDTNIDPDAEIAAAGITWKAVSDAEIELVPSKDPSQKVSAKFEDGFLILGTPGQKQLRLKKK